jgi:hypothetical protein
VEQAFQIADRAQPVDLTAAFTIGGVPFSQLLLLALTVIVLAFLLRGTRRRWQRSVAMSRESVRERYEKLKEDRTATREVDKALIELDQLARQVHGRLDTQFAKLEVLIQDADERIDKLTRLLRAAQSSDTLDITLGAEEPRELAPAETTDPAGATVSADRSSVAVGAERTDADGTESDRHGPIYRLADQGLSAIDIAERVGRTTGEVELILSLRRAKAHLADTSPAAATTSDSAEKP